MFGQYLEMSLVWSQCLRDTCHLQHLSGLQNHEEHTGKEPMQDEACVGKCLGFFNFSVFLSCLCVGRAPVAKLCYGTSSRNSSTLRGDPYARECGDPPRGGSGWRESSFCGWARTDGRLTSALYRTNPKQHGKVYLKGFYSEIIIDSWEVKNLGASFPQLPRCDALYNWSPESKPRTWIAVILSTRHRSYSDFTSFYTCVCVSFCAIIFYVLICVTTITIKAETILSPQTDPLLLPLYCCAHPYPLLCLATNPVSITVILSFWEW